MSDETKPLPERITLGGTEFKVEPLYAENIIDFSVTLSALGTLNPRAMDKPSLLAMYNAIGIVLRQVDPSLTTEKLLKMRITLPEAVAAIVELAPLAGMEFASKPSPPVAGPENVSAAPPKSDDAGTTSSPT